ncbi:MAG TPA: RidA family protein [Candidatus Baltobacteraceae bacterium]|jgi:enamine deaminase RidA (YjgF/YER057c/UK114 family)
MIERIESGPRMSKAVVHNGIIYTAGHVNDTAPDVAGQTRAILAKLESVLVQAGSDKSKLLSATIWLADVATFDEMNAVWDAWISPGNPPARATVEAKLAGPQYLVEIAVIAAR